MKKIGQDLQNRLVLQADEAKIVGLNKLSSSIYDAILQAQIINDTDSFNYDELVQTVRNELWKAACKIAVYHDLPTLDVQKIDALVAVAANDFIHSIERSNSVENQIGPFEEKVIGQK